MSIPSNKILETPIEYLKGVGPAKGELLRKEINVHHFGDLLFNFPFRYVDKTVFHHIKDASTATEPIQIKGTLISIEKIKMANRRHRLSGILRDGTGFIELVWFQGVKFLVDVLKTNQEYVVYGKVNNFKGKLSIPHPEMEAAAALSKESKSKMSPVYSSTEKLNSRGLDTKGRRKLVKQLLDHINKERLNETLAPYLVSKLKLCSIQEALNWIHFPPSESQMKAAINRLKFEEFFYLQMKMLHNKVQRSQKFKGVVFDKVGELFNQFYTTKLPFTLTNAQKRVLKEIRADLGKGVQMNRLLQGDVGSGKTMVGLMSILLALDNGHQACMMAPTEILAQQHYQSITEYVEGLPIIVAFLSGTVKGKKRQKILAALVEGQIDILIGTHALIEDTVKFKNLGLAITDEQHRFGVKQRAKLWMKNKTHPPHILVMTATPIPRTLAMTVYGDLDVSVIDELPPGRKPVKTVHQTEKKRPHVIQFMHKEIAKGRQIYVVFPLIEESEKLDLQNLQEGHERLMQYFPRPDYQISVVHGRMKPADKEAEMQRFVEKKTQIMVATTVIEVGVNVPNASVMIIENTERFGLSQLHQLRGRVGRGADQSFCILMSSYKLSKESKERIATMVRTNNGFEIAEADLKLRGPGNIQGLQQSGIMDFRLVNLVQDTKILQVARHLATEILEQDPNLEDPKNAVVLDTLVRLRSKRKDWGRIS